MSMDRRIRQLEQKAGQRDRPRVLVDWTGFNVGVLAPAEKLRLVEQARAQVGPDGIVEVMAWADDPMLAELDSDGPRVAMHWTDDM